MATLTDIRSQVTAVNTTGRTNLAAKGVTVAQDADTATIMGAIATIPSGGATPTLSKSFTWDGDTTGLESHTVTIEENTYTFYKVSDDVLPYATLDDANAYIYAGTDQSDAAYTDPKVYVFDGYVALGGAFDVVSAYFDNFESEPFGEQVFVPSVGTWFKKDGANYLKSITATLDM